MPVYGINEHKCRVEIPAMSDFTGQLNELEDKINSAINTASAAYQAATNVNNEISKIKNGTTIVGKAQNANKATNADNASYASSAGNANNASKINNKRLDLVLNGTTLNITYQ